MSSYSIRKCFIHILLFLSCLAVAGGMFLVRSFIIDYNYNGSACESYQETADFEQHFYKYVERVAAYTKLRNEGLTPDASLSEIKGRAIRGYDFKAFPTDTDQAQLEFYNRKLNGGGTSFLYYVQGDYDDRIINRSVPGSSYVSPQLQALSRQNGDSYVETLTGLINNGAPYFIIYSSGLYNTNLENYGYLTESVRDYLLNSGQYDVLYAVSICAFENTQDDFTDGYLAFTQEQRLYSFGRKASGIGILLFFFLFAAAILIAGYEESYRPLPGVTDPEELRSCRRARVSLNALDRIPAELALLLAILLYYILDEIVPDLSWQFLNWFNLFGEQAFEHLHFFLSFLVSYCIFVPLFFSGVRRAKAGTLFSNTVAVRGGKKIVHWIRRFFENRSLTVQAGVLLFLYLLGSLVICLVCYLCGWEGTDLIFLFAGIGLYLVLFFLLSLRILRTAADLNVLMQETEELQKGSFDHKIPDTLHSAPIRTLGGYINNIGAGLEEAVDEQVKSERLKTELITNVSHDIKTPLTSIINYVDLLKRMDLENEKANDYLEILSRKSWRLKILIEDLVEASKASSGAITLECERLNFIELIRQSCAEYEDKFTERSLTMIKTLPDHPVMIFADGRRTFRIVDNLLSNAGKYAMEGTRVYIDVREEADTVTLSVKNISATQLNITVDELMERFVRGDQSRSTEGSGLGLSIAESLAKLQGADFHLDLDGDLFKAVLSFPVCA